MELIPVMGLPLIKLGDDIGALIAQAVERNDLKLEDGDVVVVAQSIVSKAEGNVVDLQTVEPSELAARIAGRLNKDPREVEVILQQSQEIVRLRHVIIARTHHGFTCANAGVDHSNVERDHVTLLPADPDASAARIRETIRRALGVEVAVIISDTQGRAFRRGCLGVAIGVSGIRPLLDLRGRRDLYGKELRATVTSPADAIAATAVLVMGEADEGTPVVVVKGAAYERGEGSAKELIRGPEQDLFR